jgi:hypothetical protein
MLIHLSSHLFSRIIETVTIEELRKLLDVTANDFWHYHYLPGEASAFRPKKLGEQMVNNIIVNTIVPVVFAFGHTQRQNQHKDKALRWLDEIRAEKNSIITRFVQSGLPAKTAFDTQSILQLKEEYCDKRRCLDCAIGNFLLKGNGL